MNSFHRVKTITSVLITASLLTVLVCGTLPTHAQSTTPTTPHPVPGGNILVSNTGSVPTPSPDHQTTGENENNTVRTSFAGSGPVTAVEPKHDTQGPPQPGTIIDTDDRYQINDTTLFPYRAIGAVQSDQGSCTGFLIGPDTVATAGHCVYEGGWSTNVVFHPGRNGTYDPYGSCSASQLFTVQAWIDSANPDYDYGMIKLSCRVGDTVGWLGYRWQDASINEFAFIRGYPGDKIDWNGYSTPMWGSDGTAFSLPFPFDQLQLFYQNDIINGDSGAPVYNYNNSSCGACAIAINAYNVYGGINANRGTRITQEVFDNLTIVRNM